jgi:hypothetical protein
MEKFEEMLLKDDRHFFKYFPISTLGLNFEKMCAEDDSCQGLNELKEWVSRKVVDGSKDVLIRHEIREQAKPCVVNTPRHKFRQHL